MTDYISVADVLGLHRVLIERYGGADGLRDGGALESALYRPRSGYYEDIIAEAAALMESLAINHPFVDGNKRIAFAAVDVFLRINGYRIRASSTDVYAAMMGWFEQGTFTMVEIERYFRTIIVVSGNR